MIKLSMGQITSIFQTLSVLMNQNFSGATAFKVARLAREIGKEMETFDAERMKLVEKYGEKGDDGRVKTDENGNVKIMESAIQDCNAEFNELLNQEIQINAEMLPANVLDEMQNVTPAQMLTLEPIVNFEV